MPVLWECINFAAQGSVCVSGSVLCWWRPRKRGQPCTQLVTAAQLLAAGTWHLSITHRVPFVPERLLTLIPQVLACSLHISSSPRQTSRARLFLAVVKGLLFSCSSSLLVTDTTRTEDLIPPTPGIRCWPGPQMRSISNPHLSLSSVAVSRKHGFCHVYLSKK